MKRSVGSGRAFAVAHERSAASPMEAKMMHALRLLLVAAAVTTNVPVSARNVGQFGDVDPQISG